MRFVVVHVDAVAVDVLAQTVARAVNELRPEPRPFDDVAAGAIDLEAAQVALLADGGLDELDRGVAAVAGGGKRAANRVGHLGPRKADPRNVSKDRAGLGQLAPEVDQHNLVGPNRAVLLASGEVMRVAGVLLRPRHSAARRSTSPSSANHFSISCWTSNSVTRRLGRDPLLDELERAILDSVQLFGC